MKVSIVAAVSLGATVALLTAGCGGSSTTSSSSSSSKGSSSAASSTSKSSSADAKDYSTLLIDASDIVAPGDTFTAQKPTVNPNGAAGVATVFSNAADSREIGDTILVLPDAAAAATALKGATASLGSNVTGGTPEPAQVGSDAVSVSGTSPDGAKSVTVLLFTQGSAFTTLEFDGAPGDTVPPEFVLDVGGKQAKKIADGLG